MLLLSLNYLKRVSSLRYSIAQSDRVTDQTQVLRKEKVKVVLNTKLKITMKSYLYITVIQVLACVVLGQRVAPGVPPQHYVRLFFMVLTLTRCNSVIVLHFIYSKNHNNINNPASHSISSPHISNLHISSNNNTSSHHHLSSNNNNRHIINLPNLK